MNIPKKVIEQAHKKNAMYREQQREFRIINYIAKNKDGNWYGYPSTPILDNDNDCWEDTGDITFLRDEHMNWKDSMYVLEDL